MQKRFKNIEKKNLDKKKIQSSEQRELYLRLFAPAVLVIGLRYSIDIFFCTRFLYISYTGLGRMSSIKQASFII